MKLNKRTSPYGQTVKALYGRLKIRKVRRIRMEETQKKRRKSQKEAGNFNIDMFLRIRIDKKNNGINCENYN